MDALYALYAAVRVVPANYVPPPRQCTYDCKPSPDSSPATGWALVAFGLAGVLAAVVMMIVEVSRSSPGAAVPAELPVMDQVQREDVEQRAEEEAGRQNRLWANTLGGLLIGGMLCAGVGSFLAHSESSDIATHKEQLHMAAFDFVLVALQDSSPRGRAQQEGPSDNAYGEFAMETVFSPNFQGDGEVTFADTTNNRAVCARVPDAGVGAGAGFGAEADADKYISSGACPDAPVG